MKKLGKSSDNLKKSVYEKPKLVRYGKVTELTAAGTAGVPEGNATNNPNRMM